MNLQARVFPKTPFLVTSVSYPKIFPTFHSTSSGLCFQIHLHSSALKTFISFKPFIFLHHWFKRFMNSTRGFNTCTWVIWSKDLVVLISYYGTRYSKKCYGLGFLFVLLWFIGHHVWRVAWKRNYFITVDFLVKVNFECWLFDLIFGVSIHVQGIFIILMYIMEGKGLEVIHDTIDFWSIIDFWSKQLTRSFRFLLYFNYGWDITF